MSRQKEHFLVVDTETANTIEQPLPYDIGYAICDRQGNIYVQRSFVVAEVFCDMKDVMKSAYYAEKLPQYWEDIKNGNRVMASVWTIRKTLIADMKKYKVKKVGAYNMAFDKRALNNLIRYTSKSFCRWFFPYNTQYFDIWNCACDVLLARKSYIDFAIKNGLVSNVDNILTNAECCYKYITKQLDFKEVHCGLEDVLIEVQILAECYKQHKKMDTSINCACWRKVQHKRKELDLKAVFA